MNLGTADLYDKYGEKLQIAAPIFRDYGKKKRFSGMIKTIKVFEDNTLVRTALEQPGHEKVLVVDGGASLNCALVGDKLAELAVQNSWSGIIVYGCIRDSAMIATINIGLKALNTNPRKSLKKGRGESDASVTFAGITFNPSHYIYADEDGIVISEEKID